MLAFGNKEFRNLQEQVLENMRQIDDIKQASVVLDEFGIKVIGQIESADDLPDPEEYEGDFGDAYAVGTEAPYELYIWTRGDSLGNDAYWFNIGSFPMPGPQGETGATGEQGPSGTIAFGSMSVTTTEPGTNANVSFTNIGTATNAVYNLSWYIPRGATGAAGVKGEKGDKGDTGPQGPQGPKGDTGTSYIIQGQLSSATLLPDPDTIDRQSAYLIGADDPYNLYVIVGTDELSWFDAGLFTTAELDASEFENGTGIIITNNNVTGKINVAVDTSTIASQSWVGSNFLSNEGGRLYGGVLIQKDNSQGASVTIRAGENNQGAAYAQMYVTDDYQPKAGLKIADAMGTATTITPNAVNVVGNQYGISFPTVNQSETFATREWATSNFLSSIPSEYVTSSELASSLSEYAELSASVNTLTGDLEVGMDLTLIGSIKQPVSGSYINVFTLPSESGQLALVSDIPSLYGYATESYVNTEIGKLDYASVGALSSATVIPDITGLASVSYVDDSIASLSSVYASISDIPDMSEYATISQVSSAISAIDYASVGALSAATVIPDITGLASEAYVNDAVNALSSVYASVSYVDNSIGNAMNALGSIYAQQDWVSQNFLGSDALNGYATESYVSNSISDLSSVYAPLSDYASQAWVSANFLSSGAVPSLSGYAELSAANTFTNSNLFENRVRINGTNNTGYIDFGTSNQAYCNIIGYASGITNPYLTIRVGNTFTGKAAYYDFGVSSATMNGTKLLSYTDLSWYATTSALSSAISALNYASVGAMSSDTYIPRVGGDNDGTYWTAITLGDDTFSVPQISGTNDGSNWISLTINDESYDIGGGASYVPALVQETDDQEDPEDPTFTFTGAITNSATEITLDVNAEHPDQPGTNTNSAIILGQTDIYISHNWEEMISRENPDYDPEDPESQPTYEESVSLEKYLSIDTNDITIHNMHWDDAAEDTVDESYGLFSVARDVDDLKDTVGDIDTILQQINGGSI